MGQLSRSEHRFRAALDEHIETMQRPPALLAALLVLAIGRSFSEARGGWSIRSCHHE
jgi:hypothetical protein